MNIFRSTSYRTSHMTYQSRSIKFTSRKTKGFTLIELLVVVAIISLLTTITLAALSDARAKSRNTAKNNLVIEYIKALELYRVSNTGYPIANTSVCFGYNDGSQCFNNYPGSTSLTTSMQSYIQGDFAHRISIMINNIDFKGVRYQCVANNGVCDSYTLIWLLEKEVSPCISNANKFVFFGNNQCTYISK